MMTERACFRTETLLLALAAPWLLFPTVFPKITVAALFLLSLLWLARWWFGGPLPTTPFNGALLLWSVALAVGILVTAYPALTLPKATGLILGLALWRYLALYARDRRRLAWAVIGLALFGVAVAALGVLGTGWSRKVALLQPLIALLPRRLLALPESPDGGINPNQLAGALTFYAPLALAWVVQAAASTAWPRRLARLALALPTFAVVMGLWVLTQSRSGWIGGVLGMLALLVLWAWCSDRRWLRVVGWLFVAASLLTLIGVALSVDFAHIAALWESGAAVDTEVIGTLSLSGRVEIWSRALYAIQDFPFTGCGLGTFREVVWVLYPLFTITPNNDFAHAHNIFLQVAVDVGLPGLIAYLALLGLASVTAWQVARRVPRYRPLALGLLAGLLALHVYGLTDALAPGSKPALIFWWAVGLLTALQLHHSTPDSFTSGSNAV